MNRLEYSHQTALAIQLARVGERLRLTERPRERIELLSEKLWLEMELLTARQATMTN